MLIYKAIFLSYLFACYIANIMPTRQQLSHLINIEHQFRSDNVERRKIINIILVCFTLYAHKMLWNCFFLAPFPFRFFFFHAFPFHCCFFFYSFKFYQYVCVLCSERRSRQIQISHKEKLQQDLVCSFVEVFFFWISYSNDTWLGSRASFKTQTKRNKSKILHAIQ